MTHQRRPGADLSRANFTGADLSRASLSEADLTGADLSGANLVKATLSRANLGEANLGEADLTGADLQLSTLVHTHLANADLTGCLVYGMSAWDLNLEEATQKDLVITKANQPEITVDDLEVAQFVYLLLNNEKIRDVMDTIGKKGVLLLGRFTGGRLAVLERLRDELRRRGFLPMVFNFDKPETKDFTETVRLLAGLSSFVIADITNPRSTPLELQATVPEYMVPFVTVLEEGDANWIEYASEEGAAMTADEFAEELRALVGDAENAGLELPALIAVLADQLDAMEEAMAE